MMSMTSNKLVTIQSAVLSNGDRLVLPCAVNYHYITTDEDAQEAVDILLPIMQEPNSVVALDLETSGFSPFFDDIILMQVGTDKDVQYLFDARKFDTNILKPLFDTECWKVGHNIVFDAKFIKNKYGANFRRFFDTYLAEKVLRGGSFTNGVGYSLDAVLDFRLGQTLSIETQAFTSFQDTTKTERAKKYLQKSFTKLDGKDPDPAQLAYAAFDVCAKGILALAEAQVKALKEKAWNTLYDPSIREGCSESIREVYEKFFPPKLSLWKTALLEFEFAEVVVDMELEGMGFSLEKHQQVIEYLHEDYKAYKKDFLKLLVPFVEQKTLFGTAGINPNSPLQVLAALKKMGLEVEGTDEPTLEVTLRNLKNDSIEYKVVNSLLNYRSISTIINNYGDSLANCVNPKTKRIHCSVDQIKDTGRISNKNPNCQKILKKIPYKLTGDPQKDEDIKARPGIRECFVAKPDHTLLIYDYSQQELRVAAEIARDAKMRTAFAEGKELHSYSATLMYGDDYDQFVKKVKAKDPIALERRQIAKIVSFGSLYGAGPNKLCLSLNIDMDKAREILDRFWSSYPMLREAMDRYGDFANKVGFSNTILGRRRYYTDIKKKILWIQNEQNPKNIEDLLVKFKMNWVLEKGPITSTNMYQAKEHLIRKYKKNIARQAGNHHIQGTSADMLKRAAVDIRKAFIESKIPAKIIALVHDEIIVEVPLEFVDSAKSIVIDKMKHAMNIFCPHLPAEVEGKVTNCWYKE